MKPTVSLLLAAVIFGAASPALACRAVRPLTEAEVRDRTLVFTARVESLDRTPQDDGYNVRATLRPLRTVHGEPPAIVVAEDYVPPDPEGDGIDEVIIYCDRFWIGHELAGLSQADEVVVLGWRETSGYLTVRDLGRAGGARAGQLLDTRLP